MSVCMIMVEGAGIEVVMLVTLAMLTIVDGKNCSSGDESSNDARPCSSPSRSSSLKLDCGWPSWLVSWVLRCLNKQAFISHALTGSCTGTMTY
jgi:hypothetical protein